VVHYLLSVHSVAGQVHEPQSPEQTDEQMQQSMQRIGAVEAELEAAGALVFSGRLAEPDTATVVRRSGDEVLTTDGPFVESKEHMGGFYIIAADDLDAALSWGAKVTAAVGKPIEVRPFQGVRVG
jgi:hypothetical protein